MAIEYTRVNDNLEIGNVKVWTKDDREDITFSLRLFNVAYMYGVRLAKTRDNNLFISFPSRKGSDDRYYNHCYVELSEETEGAIIAKVKEIAKGDAGSKPASGKKAKKGGI